MIQKLAETVVEELHSGDRMTQAEFHRLYEQTAEKLKAELVGGIVFVASPLRRPHSTYHLTLGATLRCYSGFTAGTEAGDNATVILGEEEEPQPDLYLRILPEHGGQSRDTPNEYIAGAPELVAEIAHSSRAIDLHLKRRDYTRHGVKEYLVLLVREKEVRCFDLAADRDWPVDSDGIFRSGAFPGLWLYLGALVADDYQVLMRVLQQGLATPEHAAFVQQLAARRRG
jgi:hypothetical protein